jgi:hypothetical protein
MRGTKWTPVIQGERDSHWALRLVHPVVPEAEPDEPTTAWVQEAIDQLTGMFDLAVKQANATLARLGAPQRIIAEQIANERRFTYLTADGSERRISVFLTLRPAGGGSAYLGTSQSRAYIYLVPVMEKGRPAWRVEKADEPFVADTIHDLFLSVFGDDPVATLHLSPLAGHDLFQYPWN